MARYAPQVWADLLGGGTPTSAARFNAMEANMKAIDYRAAVRVTHNTTQSIANATAVALAFNTERFDTENNAASTMHDTVTNNSRLTCRTAGKYQISGNVLWSAAIGSASGTELLIRHSVGPTYIARNLTVSSDSRAMFVTTLWDMAVNEYVELVVIQNTGAGAVISNASSYSPEFMMVLVA